ncbi:hypothetical protein DFQ07_0059 [Tenacibaculum caenipelagi]|uniref:Uncharacterized protein n=2 Tax=Tenacibaculum caenipelagi TaxID=1325435 RepID=A0A4R6TN85_9FLAO|nr:hypothetical protein DFQ07_0059 [Tenacibaculum caenipelagi]
MMKIRKGTYTVYKGIEMVITEYYGHGILNPEIENHREISYSKELGKLKGFELDNNSDRFFKDIRVDKLNNAYRVDTKGIYKGDEFLLWGYNEKRDVIGLITYNEEIAKKYDFIKLSDSYIKEVSPSEIEKIWEERTKSEFDLPLPEEIKEKKIIYQKEE